ncbi:hypothetical protein [Kiloniella laminariae]|uniref:hypothetical protein n=1 Tax=Kiloniella laminariae TaxID=454162 RepID=UPI0003A99135|nr:hypothetical protein [Kiloniella laminariae]
MTLPTDMPPAQRAEAIRTLRLSLAPLSRSQTMRELLRLKVKTGSRNMDAQTLELQLEVYADELARFPADCVLQVLGEVGRGKWWPDWGEIERRLTPLETTRRRILRALEKPGYPTVALTASLPKTAVTDPPARGEIRSLGMLTEQGLDPLRRPPDKPGAKPKPDPET